VQRVVIIGLAIVIGGLAIVGAIRELGKKPDIVPARDRQEQSGPARTVVVRMVDNAYEPGLVSVRLGQTVRWVNDDDVAHTVTKSSGPGVDFDSEEIAPEELYDFTFAQGRGLVRYHCEIHPRMRGEISLIGD
jgi:plastocyanin